GSRAARRFRITFRPCYRDPIVAARNLAVVPGTQAADTSVRLMCVDSQHRGQVHLLQSRRQRHELIGTATQLALLLWQPTESASFCRWSCSCRHVESTVHRASFTQRFPVAVAMLFHT